MKERKEKDEQWKKQKESRKKYKCIIKIKKIPHSSELALAINSN